MSLPLGLICVSLGWGAKRHTASQGALYLKKNHLENRLSHAYWHDFIEETISSRDAQISYPEKVDQISDVVTRLNAAVFAAAPVSFPVVLGGDDSMSIGTWGGMMRALGKASPFGLIWIDAHMDSHTPSTTPSHCVHGMPLAVLMGHGEPKLVNTLQGIYLQPRHLVLMATRSYEPAEKAFLESQQVKIIYMDEIRERGFQATFDEAVSYVTQGTQGFGISLDLDAFDPTVTPGTGVPEPDGLALAPFLSSLQHVLTDTRLKAFQIAEFDPTCDKHNTTFNVIETIVTMIGHHKS